MSLSALVLWLITTSFCFSGAFGGVTGIDAIEAEKGVCGTGVGKDAEGGLETGVENGEVEGAVALVGVKGGRLAEGVIG